MRLRIVKVKRLSLVVSKEVLFCNSVEATSWRLSLGNRFVGWGRVSKKSS
jgi:hypothetical protein